MSTTNSYLCGAKRSPVGSFLGSLSQFSAPQLGGFVIQKMLEETGIAGDQIDEVFMGCVLSAGIGQAPARQAALRAGISDRTPCATIGKVCGSGLKAVMLADLSIRAGSGEAIVAGGMESMSQSPYIIPRLRTGLRMGSAEIIDSMVHDGLWDPYNQFHMGKAAELCVSKYSLSRESQDAYAIQSFTRAQGAITQGFFKDEIVPIRTEGKRGSTIIDTDEGPAKADFKKLPTLRPVFDERGHITAGNASSLNDGAAGLVVCSEDFLKRMKLRPLARIVAQAEAAQDPAWFTTAPAAAVRSVLKKAGLKASQIDLWEINEAFAAVVLANVQLLEIDPSKVNIRGGAIALGHPIGCSGARILVTLVHALSQTKKTLGLATLCIGGGEAVAVIVESI